MDVLELPETDKILPEYDFSGAKRGGAYRTLRNGYTIREERPDGTVKVTHVLPPKDNRNRAGDQHDC